MSAISDKMEEAVAPVAADDYASEPANIFTNSQKGSMKELESKKSELNVMDEIEKEVIPEQISKEGNYTALFQDSIYSITQQEKIEKELEIQENIITESEAKSKHLDSILQNKILTFNTIGQTIPSMENLSHSLENEQNLSSTLESQFNNLNLVIKKDIRLKPVKIAARKRDKSNFSPSPIELCGFKEPSNLLRNLYSTKKGTFSRRAQSIQPKETQTAAAVMFTRSSNRTNKRNLAEIVQQRQIYSTEKTQRSRLHHFVEQSPTRGKTPDEWAGRLNAKAQYDKYFPPQRFHLKYLPHPKSIFSDSTAAHQRNTRTTYQNHTSYERETNTNYNTHEFDR